MELVPSNFEAPVSTEVIEAGYRQFEDGISRCRDLDLAVWLQFEQPWEIRRLICRNRKELQRYGPILGTVTRIPGKAGRPGNEFWLTVEHAVGVCQLTRTKRAEDVRFVLVQIASKYGRGELIPATTDAVKQGAAWEAALANLILTVDRGFQLSHEQIRQLRQETNARFDLLSDRVGSIEATSRRDAKPVDIARMIGVVLEDYRGLCTCCEAEDMVIVTPDGKKSDLWTVDHWNGRTDNRAAHLWPVCRNCNHKLYNEPGFKAAHGSEFAQFQKRFAKRLPTQLFLIN